MEGIVGFFFNTCVCVCVCGKVFTIIIPGWSAIRQLVVADVTDSESQNATGSSQHAAPSYYIVILHYSIIVFK